MASRFVQKKVGRCSESSDIHQSWDPNSSPLNAHVCSVSRWTDREELREGNSFREQLKEKDEHMARLQDMLKNEQAKSTQLQLRCNQRESELRRSEQQSNRLKERLLRLPDKHSNKPSIEVLNLPRGNHRYKREPFKSLRGEETALRLMLERREAELREAMKLRHTLTTVLHALRVDMEHTLSEVQDEAHGDRRLDQAEVALGDHVTGGVVKSWRQVQKRLCNILPEDHSGVGTDHDKLLALMETELKESQQLVRLQQQLLQDSLTSPVPSELADAYFLEEWERLRMQWAELNRQKKTFERERQSFTDAAIRLSHERLDLEHQKASLLKQEYLCDSPLFTEAAQRNKQLRRASLDFSGLGPTSISGCLPISPSSIQSEVAAVSGSNHGAVRVQTPSTPDLYSALNLSYNSRSREIDRQSEIWDCRRDEMVHATYVPHLDCSF